MIKSWLSDLDEKQQAVIRQVYVEHRFKTYDVITTIINEKLEEWGCELKISRSSAHRVGKKIEEYIALTSQWAHLAENDQNTGLSSALLTVAQIEMLKAFEKSEDIDLETKAKLVNAIAATVKANVVQKRYLTSFIEKKKIEENIAKYAAHKGLPKQEADDLRKALMHDLTENENS